MPKRYLIMPCQDAWIVDDSATARRLIESLVALAGFQTRGFESGSDAVAAYTSLERIGGTTPEPALFVIDMNMPGLDGCASIRALRVAGFDGPIALMTGTECDALRRRAVRVGADTVLPKDAGFSSLRGYLASISPTADTLPGA